MLSTDTSPQGRSLESLFLQSQDCPEKEDDEGEEEEDKSMDSSKPKLLPECHMPEMVNCNNENSKEDLEHDREDLEGVSETTPMEVESSPCNDENVEDGNEEEIQDETHNEDDMEQVHEKSDQVPSETKIKETLTSGALTEPSASSSSVEDDGGAFSDEGQPSSTGGKESNTSEVAGSDMDESVKEDTLDEVTAYKRDILLVNMTEDDPELFGNLPPDSLLKLGPTWVKKAPKCRPVGVVKMLKRRKDKKRVSLELNQRLTSVHTYGGGSVITRQKSRTLRPQWSGNPSATQSNPCCSTEEPTMSHPDDNNNNNIPPPMTARTGSLIRKEPYTRGFSNQKSDFYYRNYLSKTMSGDFKTGSYLHVHVEIEEKLCIDTVMRYSQNATCLEEAGDVFTGYYKNNPPGMYFSMHVLLALLWALLESCMVSKILSVLSVSLAHCIVPGHGFLLALCNTVREQGLTSVVPRIVQLLFKVFQLIHTYLTERQ
ncbi:uncharacterized protein LOC134874619 [Eleginops maclovinus]|uniref:uncharacterized protein LOC134874619 n=1 Tax=Eleginops maclovinus TaxID=56733 RepID=UPI00307FFAA3